MFNHKLLKIIVNMKRRVVQETIEKQTKKKRKNYKEYYTMDSFMKKVNFKEEFETQTEMKKYGFTNTILPTIDGFSG